MYHNIPHGVFIVFSCIGFKCDVVCGSLDSRPDSTLCRPCIGFAVLCFAGLIGVRQRLQKSKLCLLCKHPHKRHRCHVDMYKQVARTEHYIPEFTSTFMCPQIRQLPQHAWSTYAALRCSSQALESIGLTV